MTHSGSGSSPTGHSSVGKPKRLPRCCALAVRPRGRCWECVGAVGSDTEVQSSLDAMLQNIVTSSAIEGEQLNVGSVRSSLARRLGLNEEGRTTSRSEGLAELLLDATRVHQEPLDARRLFNWHRWLFPTDDQLLARPLHIGKLRGDEPMQVVSGRIDRPTVHFEATPLSGLEAQLADFLAWFDSSRSDASLDPFLRAGIAHFWFVTLHPFDDGNGRITRAITDLALAQGEQQAIRFYAMSASILDDRTGYYRILEASQKGTLDITAWLQWFLKTLLNSLEQALARIDRVLVKARFWQAHRSQTLSAEQIKSSEPPARWWRKGFRERYQRGAIPSRGQSLQSHRDPSSERPARERLYRTAARWWT